jgi:general secretion pathway protein L
MRALDPIRNAFWRWLNLVAEAIVSGIDRATAKRTIFLAEGSEDHFAITSSDHDATAHVGELAIEDGIISVQRSAQLETALRGARVELLLRPERFVFKPLELPSRAAEFLDGVVRAQIDRLTPWTADQAAFGFSSPVDLGAGRIAITVAATAKSRLLPLLTAFTGFGAASVTLRTAAPESRPDLAPIMIMEQNTARHLDVHRARRALLAALVAALLIASIAGVASAIIADNLQASQDDLARRIAQRRAAAMTARNDPGDPKTVAERALAQRKNESPSAVVALEILSQIFPDNTYVTELRIEGNKLRVSGITHDAPELIRLIEQTKHFSQAAFFAPITRSPSDTGEHFNIEARMEPNFSLSP